MLIKSILIYIIFYFIIITSGAHTHIKGPITRIYEHNVYYCAHKPAVQRAACVSGFEHIYYYIITIYGFHILLRLVAVMYERTNHGLSIIIILTLYITVMIRALSDPSNDTSISKGPVIITTEGMWTLRPKHTQQRISYHTIIYNIMTYNFYSNIIHIQNGLCYKL